VPVYRLLEEGVDVSTWEELLGLAEKEISACVKLLDLAERDGTVDVVISEDCLDPECEVPSIICDPEGEKYEVPFVVSDLEEKVV
jgi:hypothetical protein